MSGTSFVIEAPNERELENRIRVELKLARSIGLCIEEITEPEYDPNTDSFQVAIRAYS